MGTLPSKRGFPETRGPICRGHSKLRGSIPVSAHRVGGDGRSTEKLDLSLGSCLVDLQCSNVFAAIRSS